MASDRTHVIESLGAGPVSSEHPRAVVIALHLPDDRTKPGPLKPELQPANPREEGADQHDQPRAKPNMPRTVPSTAAEVNSNIVRMLCFVAEFTKKLRDALSRHVQDLGHLLTL